MMKYIVLLALILVAFLPLQLKAEDLGTKIPGDSIRLFMNCYDTTTYPTLTTPDSVVYYRYRAGVLLDSTAHVVPTAAKTGVIKKTYAAVIDSLGEYYVIGIAKKGGKLGSKVWTWKVGYDSTLVKNAVTLASGTQTFNMTGNITGNLSGEVGSIASGGITSGSFGTGAITATVIADDAIDYATFASTAPTAWWNEGKTGYTVSTVSDKTGYSLTSDYLTKADSGSTAASYLRTKYVEDKTGYGLTGAERQAVAESIETRFNFDNFTGTLVGSQFEDGFLTYAKYGADYWAGNIGINWADITYDTATHNFANTRIERADTVDQLLEEISGVADWTTGELSQIRLALGITGDTGSAQLNDWGRLPWAWRIVKDSLADTAAVGRSAWDNDVIAQTNRLISTSQTIARADSVTGVGRVTTVGDKTGYGLADYTPFWNVAFSTAFTAGSMGDSLNNPTYVQGAASGLTAQQVWEYATRSLTDKSGFALSSDYLTKADTGSTGASYLRTKYVEDKTGYALTSAYLTKGDSGSTGASYLRTKYVEDKTGYGLSSYVDFWNVAFTTAFTAGSMGDSLNNPTYVQGAASGLTAADVWNYELDNTYDQADDSNKAGHQVRHAHHLLAESTLVASDTTDTLKVKFDATYWHKQALASDSGATAECDTDLIGDMMTNRGFIQESDSGLFARAPWDNDLIALANRLISSSQTIARADSVTGVGRIQTNQDKTNYGLADNAITAAKIQDGAFDSTAFAVNTFAYAHFLPSVWTANIGINWADIDNPTTSQNLSGTSIYRLSSQGEAYIWTHDTTGENTGWAALFKGRLDANISSRLSAADSSMLARFPWMTYLLGDIYRRIRYVDSLGEEISGGSGNCDTCKYLDWSGLYNDTATHDLINTRIEKADTAGYLLAGAGAGASAQEILDSLMNRGLFYGSGWQNCTLLVLDESNNPVQGIWLKLFNWAGNIREALRATDSDGKAEFMLDTTDYRAYTLSPAYPQVNTFDTFIVRANHLLDTIKVTAFDPGSAPSPNLTRIWGWVYKFTGVPDSGAIVTAKIPTVPIRFGSVLINGYNRADTTDGDGYWFLDVYPNKLLTPDTTHYLFQVYRTDGTIFKDTVTVPDSNCWQMR